MEPWEYCLKWVPKFYNIQPDEHGFRLACVKEIARVIGYAEGSVNGWGPKLENVPPKMRGVILQSIRKEDIINQARELMPLPPNFPNA